MEWWNELKYKLITISFLSLHAPSYEQQLLQKLDELPSETEKLIFITGFIDIDKNILGQMLEKTREWKINMNCHLYQKLYQNFTTSKRTKMICISYLLSHEKVGSTMVDDLLYWVREDRDWEAFDILIRFPFIMTIEQSNWLEEWMHNNRFDRQIQPPVEHYPINNIENPMNRRGRQIYNDSQNVHDTSINESVWKNIQILVFETQIVPSFDLQTFIDSLYPLNNSQLKAIKRIETDRSYFRKTKNMTTISVTLKNIFEYVCQYIVNQNKDIQTELKKRVKEELQEMSGLCATGHLSRLMNILIGFHPNMQICISEEARLKAIFMKLLEKKMMKENNSDELICDMVDPQPGGFFYQWIMKNSNVFIHELEKIEPDAPKFLEKIWKELYPSLSNPFVLNAPQISFGKKCFQWIFCK